MKKLLTLLLALIMVFSMIACNPETEGPVNQPTEEPSSGEPVGETDEPKPADTDEPKEPETDPTEATETYPNELVIGDITESYGDFYSGWTNAAVDARTKELMAGYATVALTRENNFIIEDLITVKKWDVKDNADGSRTHTFTINDNLTFNNGDPIDATHYIASILLSAGPMMSELDASTGYFDTLIGFDDYYEGATNVFAGVRLIDKYSFSMTIDGQYLPYRYDIADVQVEPEGVLNLLEGVTVKDDGQGAYFDGLTLEQLREVFLTEGTGYRYMPTMTCGPYKFGSFDPDTRTIIILKNDAYLGNYEGVKPKIDKVIIKLVEDATQMDELLTGAVDLLAGISGGEFINNGLDMVDEGIVNYHHYPRNGYGKIAFACNHGPSQFVEVRRAIAYCLDRNEFIRQYSQGYAILVHGYYGAAMNEYEKNKDVIDATFNPYAYNLDSAKQELINGGWTLNEKGQAFVEGVDTIRYKDVDGQLMPLIIRWASTENTVGTTLSAMLPAEFEKVGGKVERTIMDFSALLGQLQQVGDARENPTYHMFNMATGFSPISATWYYYSTDPKYFGVYNNNFIADAELEMYAKQQRSIPFEDEETWNETWLAFQLRWNELLPDIPLYSDDYHDFYYPKLENYNTTSRWGWGYELVYANIAGHAE